MKQPPNDKLIDSCDTISSVLPAQQQEKLALIREIVAELPDSLLRRSTTPCSGNACARSGPISLPSGR